MMKLIISLTLTWVLSNTAGALQCKTCTNAQCSSTVSSTCSSETMCITAYIQATFSGNSSGQSFKSCAPSSLCPFVGFHTYSVNLGAVSAVTSAMCCNSDDCNSVDITFVAPSSNSLECSSCVNSQCSFPVQCKGVEDRCFQASVTSGSGTVPYFGCASSNFCQASASLGSLPFLQSVGNITGGPFCCQTSFCNEVTTTAAPTTTTTTTTTTKSTTASMTTTTAGPKPAACDACCVRLSAIHLLLGLLIFLLC